MGHIVFNVMNKRCEDPIPIRCAVVTQTFTQIDKRTLILLFTPRIQYCVTWLMKWSSLNLPFAVVVFSPVSHLHLYLRTLLP